MEKESTSNFVHQAVMLDEVMHVVDRVPAGVFIDATVGGGGHSGAILSRRQDLKVFALDRDSLAINSATANLKEFSERIQFFHASFSSMEEILNRENVSSISGFLFDLGVSSPQLDIRERGFSYRAEGPLDMRMDTSQTKTARELINNLSYSELREIINKNSDERFAARIAASIVDHRPLQNTLELAELIKKAIPAAARRKGGHPAKRTFQALRMAVNDEIEELHTGLSSAVSRLMPNGCGVVISYHSGEDRIVKQLFRDVVTGGCRCPQKLPCVCGAISKARLLHSGTSASDEEISINRRSKSARLRVVEMT